MLARHDGASPAQIGLIVGCIGAGGLAGAFVAPWFQRKIPAGITITGCMWIWAVLLTLIVLVARAAVAVPDGGRLRLRRPGLERLGPDLPDADHAERAAGPDQQRQPCRSPGG